LRRAFVLLPRGLDAPAWRERWLAGSAPDETPYGYHHARALGWEITFSVSQAPRTGWRALPFKVLRRCLGFDIEHAWNNRQALWSPQTDVVWTHTEREFLPVACVSKLLRRQCPPMIGQIVWLADWWPDFRPDQRWVFRWLMQSVSVCTCHSPENLPFLQKLVGPARAKLVEFGIAPDLIPALPLPAPREVVTGSPIRVLSMGNDPHRDWDTLAKALGGDARFEVFIGSATCPDGLLAPNMRRAVCDLAGVKEKMAWCDVVVVPLGSNHHASGLTVTLEAVANGKPVVASQVGGLAHYFSESEITYVPMGDAPAMKRAILDLFADAQQARLTAEKASKARSQLLAKALTTPGFAARHVKLSEALIKAR
jgi:glycosyltransferase involved in cell wall biosynthesis